MGMGGEGKGEDGEEAIAETREAQETRLLVRWCGLSIDHVL